MNLGNIAFQVNIKNDDVPMLNQDSRFNFSLTCMITFYMKLTSHYSKLGNRIAVRFQYFKVKFSAN